MGNEILEERWAARADFLTLTFSFQTLNLLKESLAQVDADDVPQTVKLLKKHKPDLVINVALPYKDLHIMDACLEAGVNYLDTASSTAMRAVSG